MGPPPARAPPPCVVCLDQVEDSDEISGHSLGVQTARGAGHRSLDSFARRLTKLLRHDCPRRGLPVGADGFVSVTCVLSLPENESFEVSEVLAVVAADQKRRFQLALSRGPPPAAVHTPENDRPPLRILPAGAVCCMRCASGALGLLIRATQGHSIAEVDSSRLLTPVRSLEELQRAVLACTYTRERGPRATVPDEGLTLVHGTYMRFWESIKSHGLRRMGRRHVHFAGFPGVWTGGSRACPVSFQGLKEACGPTSGFRASCDLLLILDFEKALEKALRFFVAANGVVLTEGDERGAVPWDCLAAALDRKTGRALL